VIYRQGINASLLPRRRGRIYGQYYLSLLRSFVMVRLRNRTRAAVLLTGLSRPLFHSPCALRELYRIFQVNGQRNNDNRTVFKLNFNRSSQSIKGQCIPIVVLLYSPNGVPCCGVMHQIKSWASPMHDIRMNKTRSSAMAERPRDASCC